MLEGNSGSLSREELGPLLLPLLVNERVYPNPFLQIQRTLRSNDVSDNSLEHIHSCVDLRLESRMHPTSLLSSRFLVIRIHFLGST